MKKVIFAILYLVAEVLAAKWLIDRAHRVLNENESPELKDAGTFGIAAFNAPDDHKETLDAFEFYVSNQMIDGSFINWAKSAREFIMRSDSQFDRVPLSSLQEDWVDDHAQLMDEEGERVAEKVLERLMTALDEAPPSDVPTYKRQVGEAVLASRSWQGQDEKASND